MVPYWIDVSKIYLQEEITMNRLRSLMMDAKLVISRVVALTIALGLIGVVGTAPALADDKSCSCSTQMLAGHWVFATEVGQQKLLPGGDITAIGTVNIDRDGNLSGKFDATVAEFAFLPNNTFTGSVTVNPDCTGTQTFVTSAGTGRTDSIVVLSRDEIWGMSRDPLNLWTFRGRRICGRPAHE
jgi:hypothetical protein